MPTTLQAIRYRNLDEASVVLEQQLGKQTNNILTDEDEEPNGLLSVVVEDQLSPELFYRLFDSDKGVLVQVERRKYSGFGPPAEAEHYMGYTSRQVCYVLEGYAWSIEIENCPLRAIDLHSRQWSWAGYIPSIERPSRATLDLLKTGTSRNCWNWWPRVSPSRRP